MSKRPKNSNLDLCVGLRTTTVLKNILIYFSVVVQCDMPILEALFYTSFASWHVLNGTYITGLGYGCSVVASVIIEAISDEMRLLFLTWKKFILRDNSPGWMTQNARNVIFVYSQNFGSGGRVVMHSNSDIDFSIVWNNNFHGGEIHMIESGVDSGPIRGQEFLFHLRRAILAFCNRSVELKTKN